MDDPCCGRQFQNPAHFDADADHVLDRQHPLGGQAICERPAGAVLHLHVAPTIGKETACEDCDDVGMAGQTAGHRQLSLKAPAGPLVDDRHGQDLHGDEAIEFLLPGAVDHARPARRNRHCIGATDRAQGVGQPVAPSPRHRDIMPEGWPGASPPAASDDRSAYRQAYGPLPCAVGGHDRRPFSLESLEVAEAATLAPHRPPHVAEAARVPAAAPL